MAYSKQTWAPFAEGGTIITADALNHIEDGIYTAHSSVDSLRSTHSSDVSSLKSSLATTNSNVSTANGKITTLQTSVSSLDSRVDALEANPASAARVGDLSMSGFIYGSAMSGNQYDYIYNTAGWFIVRVKAEASATACGITTWDGDDTLYGSVYGSGFQVPDDCESALFTAAFASNDGKSATEGRRILQVVVADKDGNTLGVGSSPIIYDHEDMYGDRPAFTLTFAPGTRVAILIKWPVQHTTPTSGVWGGKFRVVLL